MLPPGYMPGNGKAQWVRIADVFVIGPVMMIAGARAGGFFGGLCVLFGAATVVFNGRNYLLIAQEQWEGERLRALRADA